MKKTLHLILVILLLTTTLFGCHNRKATEETEPPATQPPTAAPTQPPTAAPTKAPATQAPTQALSELDVSWFDDATFLGDSVTVALDHSAQADPALLGNAQFICSQSLSFHNAVWDLDREDAVHPTYKGETILSETAAEKTGAKKLFILLGVNDLAGCSPENTMEAADIFCERLLTHSPDVKIYFQSVTPMLKEKETDNLTNSKISSFNALLQDYCKEKGYTYIDLFRYLSDDSGALKHEYCGDPTMQGIHFNGTGCKAWANYLKSEVKDAQLLSSNPINDEPDEINFQDSTTPSPSVPQATSATPAG